MSTLTLIPAYGRDPKTVEEVLKLWREGKDFKVADVSCRWSGAYCSVRDFDNAADLRNTRPKIRFNGLQDIVILKREAMTWVVDGDPVITTDETEDMADLVFPD